LFTIIKITLQTRSLWNCQKG